MCGVYDCGWHVLAQPRHIGARGGSAGTSVAAHRLWSRLLLLVCFVVIIVVIIIRLILIIIIVMMIVMVMFSVPISCEYDHGCSSSYCSPCDNSYYVCHV